MSDGPVSPCNCESAPSAEALLDAIGPGRMGAAGECCVDCPVCGAGLELRWKRGRYVFGFTYAAGSPHFEPMGEVKVRGLTLEASEPDHLVVRIGERTWRFAVRRVGMRTV